MSCIFCILSCVPIKASYQTHGGNFITTSPIIKISWTILWVCSASSWFGNRSLSRSTFSSVRALHGLPLPVYLLAVTENKNEIKEKQSYLCRPCSPGCHKRVSADSRQWWQGTWRCCVVTVKPSSAGRQRDVPPSWHRLGAAEDCVVLTWHRTPLALLDNCSHTQMYIISISIINSAKLVRGVSITPAQRPQRTTCLHSSTERRPKFLLSWSSRLFLKRPG